MSNSIVTIVIPASDGVGAGADVSALGAEKTITIGQNFTGVIFLEASLDGGTSYNPLGVVYPSSGGDIQVLTTTVVCNRIRARKTGTTISGTPAMAIAGVVSTNGFASLDVPLVTGTGVSTDASAYGNNLTIGVAGDYDGVIIVEGSQDDVSWGSIARFQSGVSVKNYKGVFKSIRVRRIAGIFGTPVVTVGNSAAVSGGASGVAITALAALVPSADTVPYFTGAATAALAAFTAAGRAMAGAVDAAAQRAALGISALAAIAASGSAADLVAGQMPLARLPSVGMFNTYMHGGRNGVGAVALVGAKVGDVVVMGVYYAGGGNLGNNAQYFESVITVADQIQQTDPANWTGWNFYTSLMHRS